MYKYTGDSIISASFTVQVPKPLDNRTVVNNIQELYSIPAAYAYVGMTVANVDNGNIYMLVDKSKIYEKSGWRASYESIQIISCTYQEYKEWQSNTNEIFQPIDESLPYIHLDTYYYIYEDSLPGEEENQEYVRRSDWSDLLNVVSGKASNDGLARTNTIVQNIIETYATLAHLRENYAPLSMFNLESNESFIKLNFFTKDETLETFVKFSDLQGEGMEEGDYVFVTAARYDEDLEALAQYQQSIAEELAKTLKVGDEGELDSITVSHIKSPKVDNQQLVVDVTPQGLSINGDPIAKISDVPPHITLSKAEYDALVENDEVDPDTYYHVYNDEEAYVLRSELLNSYYTKTGIESYIAGKNYTKAQVDEIINQLSLNTAEQVALAYVTKVSLADTLEDYVTIAMLGGDDMEGQFIFVKASDYSDDQQAASQQREADLQNIEDTYVKKDSDASLNSLLTSTIKNGDNILNISEILKFNNKQLALEEDIPVIQMVTQEEYENLTKDPDVYYFVYNTLDNLAWVTAEELENYYTKPQIDSKMVAISNAVELIQSGFFDLLQIKYNVEKILAERMVDNEFYKARIYGNTIDITEYQPDLLVMYTTGTGMVSFLRHVITNDTALGNDIIAITLKCDNNQVILTESGSPSDNPSRVSIQLLGFLLLVTQKSANQIKQSDLFGKVIYMNLNKSGITVDYVVSIDGSVRITEQEIQAMFDNLGS